MVGAPSVQKQESKVATLHGQLAGQEIVGKSNGGRENSKLPTVAVVAHYDSAAVAPVNASSASIFRLIYSVISVTVFFLNCVVGIGVRRRLQRFRRVGVARAGEDIFPAIFVSEHSRALQFGVLVDRRCTYELLLH